MTEERVDKGTEVPSRFLVGWPRGTPRYKYVYFYVTTAQTIP